MNRSRKVVILVATVAVIGILSGIAFALWSSNGAGSGSAKALTAQTVVVNAVTGAADLYPGGPAGAVSFTLTNNNPYAITFDELTAASVSGLSGGIGGSPAC